MSAMLICLVCQSATNNCGSNPLHAMMEIANNTGMLVVDVYRNILNIFSSSVSTAKDTGS